VSDRGSRAAEPAAALEQPSGASRSTRQSEPREWDLAQRSWLHNRQVAERITVQRVAARLEHERVETERARQLREMASIRSSVQRQVDPGEWTKGERRWRAHQAQVELAQQARAAVRASGFRARLCALALCPKPNAA
jgi:hypothetical protein